MTDALAGLFAGRPPRTERRTFTAQVTRSDASGVWATELDQDTASPHGPCLGATYRDTSTCPGGEGGHEHPLRRLPKGTTVLLADTDHGVWVVTFDEGSLPG